MYPHPGLSHACIPIEPASHLILVGEPRHNGTASPTSRVFPLSRSPAPRACPFFPPVN